MLVGSIQLTSPTWWGFQYQQNSSKILLRVPLEGEPGPCPKAALFYLGFSSLVSAFPPFPDQQLFEPAHWNSGKVMEAERSLFPVIKEMGDTERLSCLGAHRAQLSFNTVIQVLQR